MTEPTVDEVWDEIGLSSRDQLVLASRRTQTLEEIGHSIGVSRERVRQVESAALRRIRAVCNRRCPERLASVRRRLADELATATEAFAEILGASEQLTELVLRAEGIGNPVTWAGGLDHWWVDYREGLAAALHRLAEQAPFDDESLDDLVRAVGIPSSLPVRQLLQGAGSPIVLHSRVPCWVRRTARHRDAAYQLMLSGGEPSSVDDVATALGLAVNAARENLRRDDRFVQLRPSGLWALAEWRTERVPIFKSALDAMVDVLQRRGPLSFEELAREVMAIYPVTTWRIHQCLTSELVGGLPDGRVGLVADGATVFDDPEPAKPDNVAVSADGTFIGYRMTVDADVLRGSGLGLPRYVAWALGLRSAPHERSFDVAGADSRVTVRRRTSLVQLSSIRRYVLPLGVAHGCAVIVVFCTVDDTARIVHGCAVDSCPAALARAAP